MPEAVAERGQLGDRAVEFIRFGGEHLAIDTQTTVRGEYALDFVQGKPRRAADRDECEPFEDARIELTAEAVAADRGDQALFLVEPQCRHGQTRSLRDHSDIHDAP